MEGEWSGSAESFIVYVKTLEEFEKLVEEMRKSFPLKGSTEYFYRDLEIMMENGESLNTDQQAAIIKWVVEWLGASET